VVQEKRWAEKANDKRNLIIIIIIIGKTLSVQNMTEDFDALHSSLPDTKHNSKEIQVITNRR
jgi:hypothetical protein